MLNQLYISPMRVRPASTRPPRAAASPGPPRSGPPCRAHPRGRAAPWRLVVGVEVGRHVDCAPRDANGLVDVARVGPLPAATHPSESTMSARAPAASASATASVAAAYVASTSSSRSSAPARQLSTMRARIVGQVQGEDRLESRLAPRRPRRTGSSRDSNRNAARAASTGSYMRQAVEHRREVLLLLQEPHDDLRAAVGSQQWLSFASSCVEEVVGVAKVVLASLARLLEPFARVLTHRLEEEASTARLGDDRL